MNRFKYILFTSLMLILWNISAFSQQTLDLVPHPDFSSAEKNGKAVILFKNNQGKFTGRLTIEVTESWEKIAAATSDCKQNTDKIVPVSLELGNMMMAEIIENFGPLVGMENITVQDKTGLKGKRWLEHIVYELTKLHPQSINSLPRFDFQPSQFKTVQIVLKSLEEECKIEEVEVFQRKTTYKILLETPGGTSWEMEFTNHDDAFHVVSNIIDAPICCPEEEKEDENEKDKIPPRSPIDPSNNPFNGSPEIFGDPDFDTFGLQSLDRSQNTDPDDNLDFVESNDFSAEPNKLKEMVIIPDGKGGFLGRLQIEVEEEWKEVAKVRSECRQRANRFFKFNIQIGNDQSQLVVQKLAPLLGIEITAQDLLGIRLERRLQQVIYDFHKKFKGSYRNISKFNLNSPKRTNKEITIKAPEDKCKLSITTVYQRISTYKLSLQNPDPGKTWNLTVHNFDDVFHFEQEIIDAPWCCPEATEPGIDTEMESMDLKDSSPPIPINPGERENQDSNQANPHNSNSPKSIVPDPGSKQNGSNYYYSNGFPNQLNYTVTGKGKTTEHIMDMTMHNPTDETISYPGSKVIITSVDSSQFYMAIIPPFTVPPHGTITIPVDGDCGTIYQPPLGDGQISSPVSTWHTPQSAGEPPNPGDDLPDDLYTPIEVSQGDIVATFPGTDVPLGASTKLEENPALLFELDETINTTVERLWEEDRINVPIPKTRAFREVRQQAKWMIFSIYEGNPYTKEDMIGRLAEQVKDQTGMEVEELPEPVQEQFTSGSTNIWETLTVIGEESKLLKVSPEDIPLPGESTEEIPIKHESKCSGDVKQNCNPASCFDFEMNIDNDWNDAEERAKVIKKVKDNVSQKADITQDEVWKEYDLSDNPTSAAAFWKPGNVGGFASAYAKTLFKTRNGWSYTGTTEKLSADAEGTSNLTMTITPGDGCKAFVVGVSKASILASSTAFDAMLGNTFGEDDKDQLAVLKFIKASGKLAVKYLIDRKTGGTKDDFGTYAKDAIKDHFKGKLKEATVDKLQEYLEDKLDNLLSELGLSSISEFLEKGITDLGSLLEEHLGFNPFKLAEELGEKIDEGLEAAFNLAFVSDTYATANGFLVITVGKKTDSAKAHTRITYSRQGTESTSEAMKGTGPNCDELFLSDVQPNSLTITTKGRAELTAQAFGNGKASSYLESQQLQVLLGVCDCGDEVNGSLNYEFMLNHQWYLDDKTQSTSDVGPAIEKELLKQIEAKRKDGTLKNGTSMEEWRKFLEDELKKITLNQVVLKPECPKSQD